MAVDPSKPGVSKRWDTLATNAKWARDSDGLLNDATLTTKSVSLHRSRHPMHLDPSSWTATASSEERTGESGLVANAIDGCPATISRTQYTPSIATFPHSLTVDMVVTTTWAKVDYVPCMNTSVQGNGLVRDYTLQASDDNVNWRSVASGAWQDWSVRQVRCRAPQSPVTPRFVRFTATSSSNDQP